MSIEANKRLSRRIVEEMWNTHYTARVTPAVVTTGIWIDRIRESKVVESWVDWDRLGFSQQLGVIPGPGQAE